METIKIAGIAPESIVDGPGIRFVVFAQGCTHACPGCHNPETQDFSGGYTDSIVHLLQMLQGNPLLSGLSLSGGEPFAQAEGFAKLAQAARQEGFDVLTYTGYSFEELFAGLEKNSGWLELLLATDTLIEGRFILAEKDLTLRFRGSRNQRILDPQASLKIGQPVQKELR